MFKGLTRREFIKSAALGFFAINAIGFLPNEKVFAADGGKPADTVIYGNFYTVDEKNPVADIDHALKLRKKFKGKRFDIDTIKILLDGVLESRTAYLSEPYSNGNDGYRGMLRFDTDTLADTVKKANAVNLTIHVHTIGDGAVTVALDAFEKAASPPDKRNAITHMQLVQPADFDRMAKLNVVAVANPFWFGKEPLYHENLSLPYLGKERAEKQYPMKSLFAGELSSLKQPIIPSRQISIPCSAYNAA